MIINDLIIGIGLFILAALGISTASDLFRDTKNKYSIRRAHIFMYLGVISSILGIIFILYSARA